MDIDDFVEFDDDKVADIADYLISHGVTVKEPQKPLTVEEASGTNDPVWMEYITGRMLVCDLVASPGGNGIYDAYEIGYAAPKPLPEVYYGKNWRCWAEKPTDAEREDARIIAGSALYPNGRKD